MTELVVQPDDELGWLPDAERLNIAVGSDELGGYAWWQPGPAPAIVLAHGWGQDATFHAERARDYHRRGWHAVCVALRGWPGSTGDVDDYGLSGEKDIAAVTAAVRERSCTELWLLGFSAGGLWMARGLPAAGPVDGAVTVNAPMNLSTVHRDTLASRMRRYYGDVITPAGWSDRSPVAVADRITTPVLAIGGTEDGMVPISQAREIAGAVRNGTYHEVVGMRHVPTDSEWRLIMQRVDDWMNGVREAKTIRGRS